MTKLVILEYPDPRLRKKAAAVPGVDDAVRQLADTCEHRLFLSATPHNGYPESFTALLEIIDDQKFARSIASPNCVVPTWVGPTVHGTGWKIGEFTMPASGVTPSTRSVVASKTPPSGKIRR